MKQIHPRKISIKKYTSSNQLGHRGDALKVVDFKILYYKFRMTAKLSVLPRKVVSGRSNL
jgi:hypothetical protein